MRIAIIGSSGFLGATMARECQGRGHAVWGSDIVSPGDPVPGVKYTSGDAVSQVPLLELGIEAVFYFAQSPHYRNFPERAEHLFGVNVLGAIRAAEAAQVAGARFFCYASSGNVYAPSFQPLSEGAPLNRGNAYALSKIQAEEALDLFAGEMTVVSTRFFGIFGPGQKSMLGASILQRVREGQPVDLAPRPDDPEDQDGLRISFTYNMDVAACLERLAAKAVRGDDLPRRLNVAGPHPISLRQFAEAAGRQLGRTPVFRMSATPRPFDLVADVSLLGAELNMSFTGLDAAMAATCHA